MEKRIKDFEDYAITDKGEVISYKYKTPRKLATYFQKSGYENIKLSKDGVTYHKLIHRLVAEAFIENPNNLPEVNHKDKNRQNNNLENLEWCSRLDNLKDSYETMSAVRNFINCELVRGEEVVKEFQSKNEACVYASENFGCSYSSLKKYGKSKGYEVRCRD